jgi:UDP-galactopyranose mutase
MAVVNYLSESVPHIRVTEYKHLTGQNPRTSLTYEYPASIRRPREIRTIPCSVRKKPRNLNATIVEDKS